MSFKRFERYQRLLKGGNKKASECVLVQTRINRFDLHCGMEDLNWTEVPQLSQENKVVLPPQQQQKHKKAVRSQK